MFRVGQKVVCINDKGAWYGTGQEIGPAFNEIVTIRGFDSAIIGLPGLLFEEYIRPEVRYWDGTERGYSQRLFRPLTDISLLQKLTKVKELEDA